MATRVGIGLLVLGLIAQAARADSLKAGAAAFARQDYARASSIFEGLATRGNAQAQTYLGFMYAKGEGVPQNYSLAAYWTRCAANQAVPAAQYFLGLMYDKGQGVPEDYILAEAWLSLAVAHAEPRRRGFWTRIRNAVAGKLSDVELAEAQHLALQFHPTNGIWTSQ